MSKKTAIPDAWDDDWEKLADNQNQDDSNLPVPPTKVSRAERLAKHAELNKKLWETADAEENFTFLQARNEPPLKSEFKPAVTLLSRKPAPKIASRNDPSSGMAQLTVDDDDDDDDDDDPANRKAVLSPEEQRLKTQRDREEKQRRYEEVRGRLFGASDAASGSSSPGNVTPPARTGSGAEAKGGRGRGRGRAGRDGRPTSRGTHEATASRTGRGVNETGETRQLYDPDAPDSSNPLSIHRRKAEAPGSFIEAKEELQQPIRMPRGPDGSGRGGFGFVARERKSP